MAATARTRAPGTAIGVATLVACLILSATALFATEPDGYFRIRPVWIDPGSTGSSIGKPRTLRIRIEAVVPLRAVTVETAFPDNVHALPIPPPWDTETRAPGSGFLYRTGLGAIGPDAPREIEFEVTPLRDGEAFASITVAAVRADGRIIREAVGLSCGPHSGKATLRRGAVEYPAGATDGGR